MVIAAVLGSTPALAKDLQIYIGTKSSGRTAANSAIMAEELKQRGYNVDYKLLGNCGAVKELLQKGSDKTLVTFWGNDLQASETCKLPLSREQFVEIAWSNPYSVCVRKTDKNWTWQPGSVYKIATNPVDSDIKVLALLGKKLGVEFQPVQYKNSGAIKKAFLSGEVDVFYAAIGPEMVRDNRAVCHYTTAGAGFLGAKSLQAELGSNIINARKAFVSWVLVDSRLSASDTARLKQDISEILAGKTFTDAINKQGSIRIKGTADEQIRIIDDLTETMR